MAIIKTDLETILVFSEHPIDILLTVDFECNHTNCNVLSAEILSAELLIAGHGRPLELTENDKSTFRDIAVHQKTIELEKLADID